MKAQILASQRTPDAAIPRDFIIVCLWSVCGIALSGLFFIAGFGAEIAQALTAAG